MIRTKDGGVVGVNVEDGESEKGGEEGGGKVLGRWLWWSFWEFLASLSSLS